MAGISVRAFGRPGAQVGDRVVDPLPGSCHALLAFLAESGGESRTRDEAVRLLWPDSEAMDERAALRTALSRIRRAFPDGCPIVGEESIRLADGVDSDVTAFVRRERALRAEGDPERRIDGLAEIARIAREPFLEGVGGAWAEGRRERYAERRLRAENELVRLLLDAGRTGEAIAIARDWLFRDPASEEAIAVLARGGARDEAVRRVAELARRGRPVSPECAALVARAPQDWADPIAKIDWVAVAASAHPADLARFIASDRRAWCPAPRPAETIDFLATLYERLDPGPDRWEIAFQLASLRRSIARYAEAERTAADAIAEIESNGATPPCRQLIDLYGCLGFVHFERRQDEAAEAAFFEGEAAMDRWGRPEWGRVLRNNFGGYRYHQGRLDEGRERFLAIIANPDPDPRWRTNADAVAHVNLAFIEWTAGRWRAMLRHAAEGRRVGTMVNDLQLIAGGQAQVALAATRLGERDGRAEIADAIGLVARAGMVRYGVVLVDLLAEAEAALEFAAPARAFLDAADRIRADIPHARSVAESMVAERIAAQAAPRASDVPRTLAEVVAMATERSRPGFG